MPYEVKKTDQCPASKPWAVVNKNTGKIHGCNATKKNAEDQMAAIGANTHRSARSDALEVRSMVLGPVELRAADTGPGTLVGYAAAFNRPSQNLGGFVEQVDPAAFNKALGDPNRVLCRYNHNDNYLLGTTDAGTLTLEIDGTGLQYADRLPDTSAGRDVAALAERGDLHYSSFTFRCLEDDWSMTEQGFPLRTLLAVQLIDVGPVNSPAYLDSTAAMRSLASRVGLDVGDLEGVDPDEIRSLLTTPRPPAEESPNPGQGATHPGLTARRRQLDALARTLQ